MDQIRLKRDCEGLSTINYKGPSTVPSMISSPAPDLVPGKSGPGKLGPSPIWRRIRPHTLWCCANWAPGAANLAHLEKVLDYGENSNAVLYFACKFDKF